MIYIALVAISTWFGGWIYAYKTIGDECERLGGFYIGGRVYECKLKENR